jgi:hypothetical protein
VKVAEQIQQAIATDRFEVSIGFGNMLLRSVGRYLAQPLDGFMRKQAS